jgi:hypothetical protein
MQLGFLLLACFWEFDFPPMMVLLIAILNDGKSIAILSSEMFSRMSIHLFYPTAQEPS